MSLPRIRFKVRRLPALVLIVASTLGAAYACRNYSHCRSRARFYAASQRDYRWAADSARSLASAYRERAKDRRDKAQSAGVGDERIGILVAAKVFDEAAADQDRQAARDLAAAERASTWEKTFYHRSWRPWLRSAPEPSEPE